MLLLISSCRMLIIQNRTTVLRKSDLFNLEYDYRPDLDDIEVLLLINHNHYNFRENKCIPFLLILAESLSEVPNLSILEKPQFW